MEDAVSDPADARLREEALNARIDKIREQLATTMSAVAQLVRDVAELSEEVRRMYGPPGGAASPAVPRQIDVFSAGCPCCKRTVEIVARLAAAEGHELRIHDVRRERVAQRAEALGIRVVPAVAVVDPGLNARRGE